MQADAGAAEITHSSGRVPHGVRLGEVAVIAGVQFQILEEHYDFRNYVIRNRILSVHGDYDNHVIWRHKGNAPDFHARRFDTMNEWLARVEADASDRPIREKIVANKPALAVDSCWREAAGWSTDPNECNTGANPSMAASIEGTGDDQVYSPTDESGLSTATPASLRVSRSQATS